MRRLARGTACHAAGQSCCPCQAAFLPLVGWHSNTVLSVVVPTMPRCRPGASPGGRWQKIAKSASARVALTGCQPVPLLPKQLMRPPLEVGALVRCGQSDNLCAALTAVGAGAATWTSCWGPWLMPWLRPLPSQQLNRPSSRHLATLGQPSTLLCRCVRAPVGACDCVRWCSAQPGAVQARLRQPKHKSEHGRWQPASCRVTAEQQGGSRSTVCT